MLRLIDEFKLPIGVNLSVCSCLSHYSSPVMNWCLVHTMPLTQMSAGKVSIVIALHWPPVTKQEYCSPNVQRCHCSLSSSSHQQHLCYSFKLSVTCSSELQSDITEFDENQKATSLFLYQCASAGQFNWKHSSAHVGTRVRVCPVCTPATGLEQK